MKFLQTLRVGAIVVPTVLIALAISGCTQSPEIKSAGFIEAGKKLLQKNDPRRAILQFQNAAKATPNNPEVYYQLSVAYLAVGDLSNEIGNLRKTLELNPKHRPAQLGLAQLMAGANDPKFVKDAKQRLDTLLEDTPENADALHALALTELKLGDSADAVQHLEQALSTAPQAVMIAATLAEAKLRQNDPNGAEDVLKKACESSPKSTEALIVLGRFYLARNKPAEAERQFQRVLVMDPNNTGGLLNLASLENQTGRKQEAEQNFKRLADSSDKTYRAIYATFLFQDGSRDEAIRQFEELVKADPEDRQTRTQLITGYRMTGRLPEAEKFLDAALKKNSRDLDALLQRGEIALAAGKYEPAEADLNQVLRAEPNSPQVHYIMGKFHQARGADQSYRQELFKALELDPYLSPIRLELVQTLIARSDAKAALVLLDEMPESQRQLMPALIQRNWALWALGETAEMRKGIDLGLSRQRTSDLLIQDGLWKLRGGNFSGARAALEEALKVNPHDLRALGGLALSYAAQKQDPAALQTVKEYASRQPKSAPVQEFLGMVLVANGDRQHARAAFEAAKTADPKFTRADLSLAQADVADNKLDDAKRRLEGVLSSEGSNTIARLWLGNIEATKGNSKAALEHFRQAVSAEPANPQALNNFAYLLAEVGNQPTEALPYAQRAKELAPDDPEYADTLGWILYHQGLYRLAVAELERAASKDGNPTWKYHLAMAYAKAGDLKRGSATLEAALKRNPNAPQAKVAQDVVEAARREGANPHP